MEETVATKDSSNKYTNKYIFTILWLISPRN